MVSQVRILLFFELSCSEKKVSPRNSFALEMFCSKAIQVLSVYYSDVLNTLKNRLLSENFRSVLLEKAFFGKLRLVCRQRWKPQ